MANDDDPADLLPGSNDTRTRQERLEAAAKQIVTQGRINDVLAARKRQRENPDRTTQKPDLIESPGIAIGAETPGGGV